MRRIITRTVTTVTTVTTTIMWNEEVPLPNTADTPASIQGDPAPADTPASATTADDPADA